MRVGGLFKLVTPAPVILLSEPDASADEAWHVDDTGDTPWTCVQARPGPISNGSGACMWFKLVSVAAGQVAAGWVSALDSHDFVEV